MTLTLDYLDPGVKVYRPPEKLDTAQWSEKNIVLPPNTCPEPGPLRFSRVPYAVGILKAFYSPYIEHIVICWGRQIGKSQSVQYPCIAYAIAEDPGPILFMLPTDDLGKYTSKNRLQPMFDITEAVNNKKTRNPDDYATMEMKFIDMVLSIIGGSSISQTMSRPVRYLFRDEIDEIKSSSTNANPLNSSYETTSAFWNRKIIDTSTPTTETGNIWTALELCQYVFEYWISCYYCGEKQVITWESIKFNSKSDLVKIEREAYWECSHCQAKIYDRQKNEMLPKGQWRARLIKNPTNAIMNKVYTPIAQTILLDDILDDYEVKKIGFHLPKWYGAFANTTFGYAAKEFLQANNDFENTGMIDKLRDWTQFWSALPWEMNVKSPEKAKLLENAIELEPMIVPKDAVALTCGIDPGQGGFWFVVLAWGRDMSPHLVHYGFLHEWDNVRELTWENVYQREGDKDDLISIWRAGIDTGGSKYEERDTTMTEEAYMWLRKHGNNKVFGFKGVSKPIPGNRRLKYTVLEQMPKGEKIMGGLVLWNMDSDMFKDIIHYRLAIEKGKAGRFTFYKDTGDEFLNHILAETKKRNRKGQLEWVRTKKHNHWLDCCSIAYSLADPECHGGVMVYNPQYQQKIKDKQEERKSWIGKKKRGWINR